MANEKPQFRGSGLDSLKELADKTREIEEGEIKELFDRLLNGKFDRLPEKLSGETFEINLPPITGLRFVPGKDKETGKVGSLNVVIFYEVPGKEPEQKTERHITWGIGKNGLFTGNVPPGAQITKNQLSLEILRALEKLHLDFWNPTSVTIDFEQDPGSPREIITPGPGPGRRLRPEVLEFYAKQPGRLFGVFNENIGFGGYDAAFFRGQEGDFTVLESQITDNAAFVVDLPKK